MQIKVLKPFKYSIILLDKIFNLLIKLILFILLILDITTSCRLFNLILFNLYFVAPFKNKYSSNQ